VIETVYAALRDGKPHAAAACYASDPYFEDIAFQLHGRERICQMWRLVCSRNVRVTFDSVAADDNTGSGHWVASYTFSETGRPIVNDIRSSFKFSDGLIADHRDQCDPHHWASQAYTFPKSLLAGYVAPLRRFKARQKLEQFIRENPES